MSGKKRNSGAVWHVAALCDGVGSADVASICRTGGAS